MNQIIFLFILMILAIGLPLLLNISPNIEGYSNYLLNQAIGNVPESQNEILVQDIYPSIGKNELSNNDSSNMWWHYPIFKLGSYKQITNNIKYPNNPDIGRCMPGSMCGALYNDKKLGDNVIKQLPPVNPNCGIRVGYFNTDVQLIDSLPYYTNMPNILY
jgi:hypothetical protein